MLFVHHDLFAKSVLTAQLSVKTFYDTKIFYHLFSSVSNLVCCMKTFIKTDGGNTQIHLHTSTKNQVPKAEDCLLVILSVFQYLPVLIEPLICFSDCPSVSLPTTSFLLLFYPLCFVFWCKSHKHSDSLFKGSSISRFSLSVFLIYTVLYGSVYCTCQAEIWGLKGSGHPEVTVV